MKKIIELIIYLIGLNLIGLGINICVHTGLGGSTWDAASFTLADIALTPGVWVFILGIILTISINLINYKHITKATPIKMMITITSGYIVGLSIDFWNPILSQITSNFIQYQLLLPLTGLLGVLTTGFGIALYTQTTFEVDPIDNFMVQLVRHQNFTITKARYITDATALLLTLIAGTFAYGFTNQLVDGYLKIGTIIVFLTLSPVIAYFSMKLKPLKHIFKN